MLFIFFFFKQKTAYEMRISDWSSDVCSSDLLVLDPDAPVGQSLRDALDLDDTVFTLKLTPNRADCLSILGVAREVAALTGAPLSRAPRKPVAVQIDEHLPVEIQAPDLCGRFAGRVVRGVNRSEEHTSELQSLMRISYAAFCL